MEEMHDQFREEETAEIRELQRELETTAKACRIVNFKLRKAERRCDQLEAEKVQAEEKSRQLEARFRTSDDRQHLLELEEELRMAKVLVGCIFAARCSMNYLRGGSLGAAVLQICSLSPQKKNSPSPRKKLWLDVPAMLLV